VFINIETRFDVAVIKIYTCAQLASIFIVSVE